MKGLLTVAGFALVVAALVIGVATRPGLPELPDVQLPYLPTPVAYGGTISDSDTYDVLDALLEAMVPPPSIRSRTVPITVWTGASGVSLPVGAPADWLPVRRGVVEANAMRFDLDKDWARRRSLVAPTELELQDIILSRHSSGDRLWISWPGFNPEHTKALIFGSYSCGALCGNAGWLAFEKINGRWEEAHPKGFELSRSVS